MVTLAGCVLTLLVMTLVAFLLLGWLFGLLL